MTQRPLNSNISGTANNVLTRIREDMEVYGANGDHIGEVEFVYMGASSPVANEMGTGAATTANTELRSESILDVVANAFRDDNIPEVLRTRLEHDGFIRVEADGLFTSDRYVLPEQIASVSNDRVILTVNKDDLIKD
jgi:hypothetical protein